MKQTVQFFGSGVFSPLRKCLPHFRKAGLAALLMLSASGMQAADSPGVKFNSGVRYSQWAIDSRANDFYANTTAFGLAKYKSDGATIDEARNDTKGKLDYVPGLVAKSMIEAADYYQSFDWSKPWFASVKEYGDTYYKSVPDTGGSLDDLNAVKLYIGIYNDKAYASDADKTNATTALDRAKAGLIAHNNSNSIQSGTLAGDAVVGGWFHKADYNNQMWLDGAYMGSALLGQLINFYGNNTNIFGSKEADWQMACKQLNIVWNMCWDSTDKLMYHAFEANAGTGSSNSNANTWYGLNGKTQPYTFHSAAYWGRANAWYLFALVDVLEAMKNDGQESTANYATLKQHLADLAAGIKARQSAEGGWYQLLDKDNTFTATSYNGKSGSAKNYIETSATSLFSAAFFKAVRLGLLDDTYKEAAKKAFELVVNDYTYLDANNNLEIWGSCRSAGLGGTSNATSGSSKFRDGSNEYYLLGYDVSMVKKSDNLTEGKVLGGFIMAATEYERAYQNQDQKQILFARDLAPEYDFTSAAGSLDATAYGSGSVAYQWYKDGAAVADATSATFAPTENGEYYCTATVDGTSITTSTASVKAKTTTDGGDDTPDATTGTVTFSGSDLASYKSPLTDATKTVTITTSAGSISGESGGDIKVAKEAAFTISVPEGKYIKSIQYSIKQTKNGDLTLSPAGTKTASSDNLTYTCAYSDKTLTSVTATNAAGKGSIQVTSIVVEYASTSSEPTTTQYIVTATANPTEAGTVAIKAGDNTVASGSKVDEKTSVTFTATPSEGYEFAGWTVNNAAVEGTATTYTVASLAANTTVVANFKKKQVYVWYVFPQGSSVGTATATANGQTIAHGATVDYGTEVTFTATPAKGYKFSYWHIEGAAGKVIEDKSTVNPQTVTMTEDRNFMAYFEKEASPVEQTVVYNFPSVGTTTSNNSGITVNDANILFGTNFKANEGKYLIIKAKDNGGFKAGDIVTIKGTCNKENSEIVIYDDPNAEVLFTTPAFTKTEATYTYTVERDCDALYLGRFGGSSTYVTYLNVTRPASSADKIRLIAQFASNLITVVKGTNVVLPELTVKAGETELASSEYTVTYTSNDEKIATVDNAGKISVIGLGTVTIVANVTPKNTDKYEATTATYQITVKEATPLDISTMDVTINTTDAEVEQPIIKVYGDNDKLLTLGTDYTLSFTTQGGPVHVDANGVFTVDGKPYAWTKGTTLVTVTAKPVAASLGDIYTDGTLTFTYDVTEGKITPKFLDAFNGITVQLAQYNNKNKKSTVFTVPLIYDGEDVSDYFNYTFTVTDASGATVTSSNNKTSGNKFTYRPDTEGTFTIKVAADVKSDASNPDKNYSDVYNNPSDISFTVVVSKDTKVITVSVDPSEMSMYTGTTEGAPEIVVMSGTDILADDNYTAEWTSFTPGIVKVDKNTGKLEAVSEGEGSVRVVIRGENLQSVTAFVTIHVDDPALYRAKLTDNNGAKVAYGNQARMWNQDKTMETVLGSWAFPKPVTPDAKITSEQLSNGKNYQWGASASQAKWKLTGFPYVVDGNGSKNARQENGSNVMPNSLKLYNSKFEEQGTVRDAMFNVPCSGSFIVFNPATNGHVNVHIFQNGVFDTTGGDKQYRPQRRVFVIDEQGSVVATSAKIENANGKLSDWTIGNYTWDVKGDTPASEEQVKEHFGLDEFSFTADGFKNNVYENKVSTTDIPNDAKSDDVKGSSGWSVLADSPVTYSFDVKAGKTYYLYNFGSKIGFYGYTFEEDKTKPVVDQLEFDDNQTNEIKPTEAGHVAQVKIDRKLKANQWTTLVLPFSLTKPQVDAIFGETYGVSYKDGQLVPNEQGTQILYFDRIEGSKAVFVRHAYNTVVAGKPFLIKPTKDVECINTADCADFPYVTIESEKPAEWCKGDGYAWVSSYSNDMTVKAGDCFISGSKGEFMNYTGADSPMPGFRGYLKRTDYGVQDAKPLRAATGSFVADDTTSAIDGIYLDSDGSAAVEGIADGKVYNMSGQVVATSAAALKSLPSGVYMLNGKKIVK